MLPQRLTKTRAPPPPSWAGFLFRGCCTALPAPHPLHHARSHAVAARAPPRSPGAEDAAGGELAREEEWLERVAAVGRAAAAQTLPLLASKLHAVQAELQGCMQGSGKVGEGG